MRKRSKVSESDGPIKRVQQVQWKWQPAGQLLGFGKKPVDKWQREERSSRVQTFFTSKAESSATEQLRRQNFPFEMFQSFWRKKKFRNSIKIVGAKNLKFKYLPQVALRLVDTTLAPISNSKILWRPPAAKHFNFHWLAPRSILLTLKH